MERTKTSTTYAILVVDMLNDFLYGKLKCMNAKRIIPKIKLLLEISRENKIPVFYCNDAHLKSDDYEFKLWGPHAIKDTRGAQIIDDLMPVTSDTIIQKRTYSAFYNTKLETFLKKKFDNRGPDVLVITGIHTNICVKHTAFDAFIRGYGVILPEDGVTAFHKKDHVDALEYMKTNYGAKILKTTQLIDLITK